MDKLLLRSNDVVRHGQNLIKFSAHDNTFQPYIYLSRKETDKDKICSGNCFVVFGNMIKLNVYGLISLYIV